MDHYVFGEGGGEQGKCNFSEQEFIFHGQVVHELFFCCCFAFFSLGVLCLACFAWFCLSLYLLKDVFFAFLTPCLPLQKKVLWKGAYV